MRVGSGIGPRTCAPVRFAVFTISRVDMIEHAMIKRLQTDADILAFHVLTIALFQRLLHVILATTPAPTVRPPSRMAKRSFSSMAIGAISSTSNETLSPGITISVPSGSVTTPVTSVVRK